MGRGAYRDRSLSCSAFAAEGNLDAERAQEGLRAPKPTGERARILGPTGAGESLCGRRGKRTLLFVCSRSHARPFQVERFAMSSRRW
jgi:hypothetical protein